MIKLSRNILIILSIFSILMIFTGCVSATGDDTSLAQDVDDVINVEDNDAILTVEESSVGTDTNLI